MHMAVSNDPPMTHEQRLALIVKPFPVVRRMLTSYPHAGTIVNDFFSAGLVQKIKGRGGAYEGDERFSNPVLADDVADVLT